MSGKSVAPKTGHAKATANGTLLADTTSWFQVEGNVYFPPDKVKTELMTSTSHSTHCPWKGDAAYYSINAGGSELENAAWYYPTPLKTAEKFKDYVAFYKSKVDIVVD